MERIAGRFLTIFVAAIIFVAGCTDMADQPSIKPQEAAVAMKPAGTVPVQGTEMLVAEEDKLEPPHPDHSKVAELGPELFAINCAMCHGPKGKGNGPVGLKLNPPAPDIRAGRHGGHTARQIFMRITTGWGRMPSFRNRLSWEDRWVLAFHVSEFGNELHGDKRN